MSDDQRGIVFNIQKYSVHDGPGIRTLVFMKGCPLRCLWCCNPESQRAEPELGYHVDKCFGCGRCAAVCTHEALQLDANRGIVIDRTRCTGTCPQCTTVCPDKALVMYGEPQSVSEVLKVVEQDALFYSRSGGGLTVSGGEPFMQPGFLMALIREARRRRFNVAIETCAYVDEAVFLAAMPYVNYLMVDIKHPDSDRHRAVTGVPNFPVFRNIRSVRAAFPELPVKIRTPVIPGINDDVEAIRHIAAFARECGTEYELLPYHRMGTSKYESLQRAYPIEGVLDDALFQRLQDAARTVMNA